MVKKIVSLMIILMVATVFSQTSTQQATRISNISRQGSIGSRTGTSGQRGSGTGTGFGIRGQSGNQQQDYSSSQLANFLAAIIGSYLRHPDPKVRIQAIQSLTGAMVSGEGTGNNTNNNSGIRGLFGIDVNNTGNNNTTSGGIGGAIFIPDLFVLLSDPDPEVQDMASMGLDILFGTDVTILRFMDDPDPIVRQYATKIYSTRSFSGDTNRTTGNNNNEYEEGSLKELVALRTLLVRLKYEKDEGVKKVLTDSIELYLQSIGLGREGQSGTRGTSLTGIFGVDPSIIKYLNDDNVEVRKNAVKIISAMEYNPQILNILLERLKKETDDGVKEAIQNAIDSYTQQRSRALGTQGLR